MSGDYCYCIGNLNLIGVGEDNGMPFAIIVEQYDKDYQVITEEPASDRLLNASAVIAIDELSTPARYLIPKRTMFKKMPTQLHSTPIARRLLASSPLFFMKILESSFIIIPPHKFEIP